MAETAALLVDEVLPERPLRQWVLSLPHALRFLLATNPAALTQVLEKRGLIERDNENARLTAGAEPGPLDDLIGHSITYRIATGPRAGQKLFTLQTVPPRRQGLEGAANVRPARAGSHCMPACTSGRASARSSSGCVATSVARPSPRSVWRWYRRRGCT